MPDWFKMPSLPDMSEILEDVGACEMVQDVGAAFSGVVAPVAQAAISTITGDSDEAEAHWENAKAGYASLDSDASRPWFRGDPLEMISNIPDSVSASMTASPTSWMSLLPADRNVVDVFLVGTHDTAAGGVEGLGAFSDCQSWTFEQQLNSGVRAFDIRAVCSTDGRMPLYHGPSFCQCFWDEYATTLERFLEENPTEFIILRLVSNGCMCDEEAKDENDTNPWGKYRAKALAKFSKDENKAGGLLWNFAGYCAPWPTVAEARGKIIVWDGPMKTSSCGCVSQDNYSTGDVDLKIAEIFKHSEAIEEGNTCLQINFCSAQGQNDVDYITPAAVAVQVNEVVLERAQELNPAVYFFDFPGPQLVEKMVQRNFE